jgi:two-component system NtrC family response regulator
MGEQVDHDDDGLDRLRGDAAQLSADPQFGSDVIRADFPWRGARPARSPSPRTTPFAPPMRRAPSAADFDIAAVIVGSSKEAKELRQLVRLYAECDAPVLIVGETGVGKELVARELHRLSPRRAAPFYAVNAGAIPETLATSEFFGHAKGAFTGAIADRDGAFLAADGGVLFLDEIGEMPLSIQAQLLRVLDDGMVTRLGARNAVKVDFRLIAATNVDLADGVASQKFRSDLYFRVSVLTIVVPPLRQRGEDVIEIAEQMIASHPDQRFCKAKLAPNAVERLKAHRYPGNVRELRNILYRALVRARGGRVLAEHIETPAAGGGSQRGCAPKGVKEAKDLAARLVILKALRAAEGNVTRAAESAESSRGAVHAVMKEVAGGDLAAELAAASAALRALIED